MDQQKLQAAYVHVPFCVHRCGYCDFTVVAGRDDLIGAYLECLEREIASSLVKPHTVQTLFIGGGTPTYLPPDALKQFLTLLGKWLPLQAGGEFSIEANPAGLDAERIAILADHGVNRLSLGVQSFQAQHLRTLERDHRPEDVAAVVQELRRQGFDNVSLDLIYGVPGMTLDDWTTTLDRALQLQPEHVSTYGLTFEKGTAFWTRRLHGDLRPVPEEIEREMYAAAMDRLDAAGYRQYELSNFAKPGFECRHNQVYWRAEPYYGFGPGAAGYLGGERRMNHKSVTTWIKRVRRGESPVAETESLTPELLAREAVMLGLRQKAGIDRDEFERRFGRTVESLAPEAWMRFVAGDLLELTSSHVRLSREGRFVADTVVAEFL